MPYQIITTRGLDPDGKPMTMDLPADVFGPLAVHIAWDSSAWCVTHMASGISVCSTPDHELACNVAQDLASLDWGFDDPTKMPTATKKACREYFQNFKDRLTVKA